ncbi:hypothetical protein HPP92_017288 [Vanilla planifolia]|uniref:Uncharacterized protein n=1 Tax=Vanilla planifolia TaxID=51239 RepID=A0A835UQV9_VANPL|nr:hypothetical protein HPP92_017288 [Vanilla planifolia]
MAAFAAEHLRGWKLMLRCCGSVIESAGEKQIRRGTTTNWLSRLDSAWAGTARLGRA